MKFWKILNFYIILQAYIDINFLINLCMCMYMFRRRRKSESKVLSQQNERLKRENKRIRTQSQRVSKRHVSEMESLKGEVGNLKADVDKWKEKAETPPMPKTITEKQRHLEITSTILSEDFSEHSKLQPYIKEVQRKANATQNNTVSAKNGGRKRLLIEMPNVTTSKSKWEK